MCAFFWTTDSFFWAISYHRKECLKEEHNARTVETLGAELFGGRANIGIDLTL